MGAPALLSPHSAILTNLLCQSREVVDFALPLDSPCCWFSSGSKPAAFFLVLPSRTTRVLKRQV